MGWKHLLDVIVSETVEEERRPLLVLVAAEVVDGRLLVDDLRLEDREEELTVSVVEVL